MVNYQLSGGVGRVYLYPGGVRQLTAEPAPTIINGQSSRRSLML
ncbi:hypothetical protein [Limnospira platensis]|nr:hypothetical protein [Arthrospira platensis]MDF2212673.1 hypothetical protein [Arthrospira platensis NCB002]